MLIQEIQELLSYSVVQFFKLGGGDRAKRDHLSIGVRKADGLAHSPVQRLGFGSLSKAKALLASFTHLLSKPMQRRSGYSLNYKKEAL